MLGYFDQRFGIPLHAFTGYRLFERHKGYSIVPDSSHLAALASLKVHSVGLPVLRKVHHYLKPTTVALQRFGQHATRHTYALTTTQAARLLQEHELPLECDWQPGYILLRHQGRIVGCGLYTPGRLRSQIPRRQSVSPHFATLEARDSDSAE